MKLLQLFFKETDAPEAKPTEGGKDLRAQVLRLVNDPNVEITEIAILKDVK